MKALQTTMLVLAVFLTTVYTVRHAYHRWLEPQGSVLDKYEGRKQEFQQATSLKELTKKYDEAHNKVKQYEANKDNPKIQWNDREEEEPYRSEQQLQKAIEEWEMHSREIYELHCFWLMGLALLVGGYILYRWASQWLGMAILMAAFSEMIYWASPNFISERGMELYRMLTQKFIFSLLTLVLLFLAGLLTGAVKWGKKE